MALVLFLTASPLAAAPRQVWLWFADGSAPPPTSPSLCSYGMSPPPYACTFAATPAECKAAIQKWLDRWFADFNLVFTYERPATGPYDTVIITSDGAWCLADERTTSTSPLPTCEPTESGPVVVFQCRDDARKCASIIGQEQAHLVGLEHTPSPTDIMNPQFLPDHDGFEDRDNPVSNVKCRRPQNSYRLMLERLGPWPGGPKPSPLGTAVPPMDAAASDDASAPIDAEESPDAPMAEMGAAPADAPTEMPAVIPDDAGSALPDAAIHDAPVAADAVSTRPPADSGGCGCAVGGRAPGALNAGLAGLGLMLWSAMLRGRRRRRLSGSSSARSES